MDKKSNTILALKTNLEVIERQNSIERFFTVHPLYVISNGGDSLSGSKKVSLFDELTERQILIRIRQLCG